jgi:superfamily II DNA or RNA helicase
MLYLISKKMIEMNKRTLIIVPTTTLVEQMTEDFGEYSNGEVIDKIHKIYQGKLKETESPIVISTWQSIYKQNVKYFDQFDCILGDECHGVAAKCLRGILEKANAEYRIGFTGTMEDAQSDRLVIEGLLGPTVELVKLIDLIDREIVARLKVECSLLQYPDNVKKKMNYQDEINFLVNYEDRTKWISKLAGKLSGNVFVLFSRVEHGKNIVKQIKEMYPEKETYIVYGDVKTDERNKIRHLLEGKTNIIVVASYQVFSTGISVRNLHHAILAGPTKSKKRLLQSLGRVLRLHQSKQFATLWDISDDLQVGKSKNITLKHFLERMNIYINQEFKYRMRKAYLSAL